MHEVLGWVYAMSNTAMPGLLKIGFSLKDPALRATELFTTGVPSRFRIEYCALVHSPERIEVAVHQLLADKNHDKEFFSCSIEQVVAAIRKESGTRLVLERNDSASQISKPAPSEVWRAIQPALETTDTAVGLRNNYFRVFVELETIYRHLEVIDSRLADEFSDAVTDECQKLHFLVKLGANGLAEASNISYCLMALASKLLSAFCAAQFFGDVEAFRLFTELRLIGHWDLADSFRRQLHSTGIRASSRDLRLQIRGLWSERTRVRTLCGLNSVLVNGGDLILASSPKKWPGIYPGFDLYYSAKYTCNANHQSGSTDIPFLGVPHMPTEALLRQASRVETYTNSDSERSGRYTWGNPLEFLPHSAPDKVEALLRLSNDTTNDMAFTSVRRALTVAYLSTATADMPALSEFGFAIDPGEWKTFSGDPHRLPSSEAADIALRHSLLPFHLSRDGRYSYRDQKTGAERVLQLRQPYS
jgi:hypothetical protein